MPDDQVLAWSVLAVAVLVISLPRRWRLRTAYRHYNKVLYGGALPDVNIRWTLIKSPRNGAVALGMAYPRGWVAESVWGGNPSPGSRVREARIELSPICLLTGRDKTLIHEMIHIWQFTTGEDLSGDLHGKRFQAEADRCSKVVGFDVSYT